MVRRLEQRFRGTCYRLSDYVFKIQLREVPCQHKVRLQLPVLESDSIVNRLAPREQHQEKTPFKKANIPIRSIVLELEYG